MKFYEEKDYDALSQRAANIIAAQIVTKPDCVLGLATGSSPVGIYKRLIEKYENMVLHVEVWLPYLTIALAYVLPLLLLLFSFKKKSEKRKQLIQNDEEKREEKGLNEEVKA